MNFSVITKKINTIDSDALVVFLLQDETTPPEKQIDTLTHTLISKLRKAKDFTGETGKIRTVFKVN